MVYSSVAAAHKQNHGDIYVNDSSGVTTEIVANAFAMVKARVSAAGLTPPATSDILAVAENFYIKAEMVWKGRMMGDLPTGSNGSIISNDNVNNSYKMFMQLGNEQVDNYIASVATNTQPNDTAGVVRSDAIGNNFKLHQKAIGTFTEV